MNEPSTTGSGGVAVGARSASDLTRAGIAALKSGNQARARQLLRAALRRNPDDSRAWLWLSGAVTTDQARVVCLQQVLRIEPENEAATRGLVRLAARQANSPAADGRSAECGAPDLCLTSGQCEAAGALQSGRMVEGAADEPCQQEVIVDARPSLLPVGLTTVATLVFLLGLIGLCRYVSRVYEPLFGILLLWIYLTLVPVTGFQIAHSAWIRLFTRYTLSGDGLVVHTGWIRRSRQVIPLGRIQNVVCRRKLPGRLVGVCDLVIELGDGEEAVRLIGLRRCLQVREALLDAVQDNAQSVR
jgi:membrane protein YdbS with pleckstrin-like domain